MGVQEWLFNIALKKAIQKGAIAASSSIVALPLADWGISIQQDVFVAALIGFATGLIEFVRNWMKVRFGWKFL